MKIKTKYNLTFSLIIILFFIIFLFFSINKKSNPKIIKLNEVTRSIFYAPQYAAIELGYFKDEEIKIDLSTSSGSDKVMISLISDKFDIVLSGAASGVYVFKQGCKNYPVAFSQLTKRDGNFLIGKDENFQWENLNNKKIICGRKGGMPHMVFNYIVNKKNIKAELITNISLDSMPSAYISGLANYVNLLEPAASNLAIQSKSKVLSSLSSETEDLPYTLYWCKKEFIENNNEIIEKFTKAIERAQNWIEENDEKTIATLIKPYFLYDNFETLTLSIKKYKELGIWPKKASITKRSIDFLQEIMILAGELNKENSDDIKKIFIGLI